MRTSSRKPLRRSAVCAAAMAMTLSWTATAPASPTYPEKLQDLLDMDCAPPCTLCHRDFQGGLGTAIQPFGEAMANAGLLPKDDGLLKPTLAVLEDPASTGFACAPDGTAPCDSDGDGVGDVDELREGTDPNEADKDLCQVKYGCGARVAPKRNQHDRGTGLLGALTAIALWAHVRRRRYRRADRGRV